MISESAQTNLVLPRDSLRPGWLRFSQKMDYGLVLLVELGKRVLGCSDGKISPVSLRDIAEKNGLSFFFLQKAAADLKQANLIASQRGKHGGYVLAKSPAEISLQSIVEAHEGPIQLMRCLASSLLKEQEDPLCPRQGNCGVRPGMELLQDVILTTLQNTTLADFLNPTLWQRKHRSLRS